MRRLLITAITTLAASSVLAQVGGVGGISPSAFPVQSTVSALPTADGTQGIRIVTDGASSSDCSTGGGSTVVACIDTGSWTALGSGGGGGSQNLFETIDAPAGTDPVADSTTDTLTLAATSPVTITGDASTDTLTFALTQNAGTDVTADLEEETHAPEHAAAGSDPVTITEAQVSDLVHTTDTDDQSATEVPYTPTTGTDWPDPDPTEVSGALDGVAGRVTVLESAGGGAAFSDLTSGTNTTAAMLVGTGASLGVSGTGTIGASSIDQDGDGVGELTCTGTLCAVDPDDDGTTEIELGGGTYSLTVGKSGESTNKSLFQGNVDGRGILLDHAAYNGSKVTCSGTGCQVSFVANGSTSGTVPTLVPNLSYLSTGVGVGGANDLRLISSSTSGLGQTSTETTMYVEDVNDPKARTCSDSGDANPGFLSAAISGASNMEITVSDVDGCVMVLQETGATGGQHMTVSLASLAGGTLDLIDSSGVQETGTGCSLSIDGTATFIYSASRTRWLMTGCEPNN